MSIKIKGNVYFLIDVIVLDDVIYDIYEDNKGHRIKLASGVVE